MFKMLHPTLRRTMTATLLIASTIAPRIGAQPAPTRPPAEPTPIPDVALTARDGSATTTAKALPAQGHWLLLHIQRGSAASESLLRRIHGDDWSSVPPHLVVIVSGAAAGDVEKLATTFPDLAAATWYADEPGTLAAALDIKESPRILAVNNRGIQWTLSGVLSGSKRMPSVLTSWVTTPSVPTRGGDQR